MLRLDSPEGPLVTLLHIVKELLGHESIQTTQIYLHTSSKRFKDLYNTLAGL